LRLSDPLSPRKFKIPLNIPFTFRGERVEFPLIAIVGFIGIVAILVFTMITHPIGRIAGPSWIVLGLCLYFVYRKRKGLPLLHSRKRDWRTEQMDILRRAGELELMDEYIANVKASDERHAKAAV
jgi:APA family basic amino acid/polyamine antiporter